MIMLGGWPPVKPFSQDVKGPQSSPWEGGAEPSSCIHVDTDRKQHRTGVLWTEMWISNNIVLKDNLLRAAHQEKIHTTLVELDWT